MSKDAPPDKFWLVRDVPAHTRMKIKLYAAVRDMTHGQALVEMVAPSELTPEHRALIAGVGRLAADGMRLAAGEAGDDSEKTWGIKGVPRDISRAVKIHSVVHDMTMAGALEQMVDRFLVQGTDDQCEAADMPSFGSHFSGEPEQS